MDPINAYANLYSEKHITNLNKLIDVAKKKEIPVLLTRWIRTKPENPIEHIDLKGHWSFFVPDDQTNILKKIYADDTQTVEVKYTNAFMNPDLKEIIKEKTHLILAGAWLESCIINTTRCALDNNISVSVVRNASTGHFPFNFISLIDIQLVYGKCVRI